jgi:choloylglycine hydrolase
MCTGVRFNDAAGNMYFGRNLDWSVGYGQKIVVTPKGYHYHSAFLGEMAPKYANIAIIIIINIFLVIYFN